ncbi:hypothetical protein BX666DRAFT_1884460 [Dichotomocladium elegans]|nr:hypothetical protein BX666DRAFT_1884460 [Dichotomocladium elegans]
MRSGFVYAAICVSIAAFSQVDAKTVTEYRTVTTTEYRDRMPTNTAIVDEKPKNEVPPQINNGGGVMSNTIETVPPKATATGSKKTGKPGQTAKPTQDAKPPHNTANVDASLSHSPAAVPTGAAADASHHHHPVAPVGTASAPVAPPAAGTPKAGHQNPKPSNSVAGHSNVKSSAAMSATGFDFSPMTLAPESSLTLKPSQLREMTASKHAAAATAESESTSAAMSSFYAMPYATIAAMTVLGMVANALIL